MNAFIPNPAEPIPFKPEAPQPLLREISKGEAYPVEALGPLQAMTEAAHDITQAPVAISAQCALSIASLAVQPFVNVEVISGDAPLGLFLLIIAISGERKSANQKLLMQGLRQFEKDRSAEYRLDEEKWQNAKAIWKADHEKIMTDFKKKAGNRTAAEADLDALGPEPPAPLAPNLTATEPTLEGLHKLFACGQPSLGVFSDEGAQFLGGHAMNSENRMKTIAGLSDLWGGEAINRTRAGDGSVTLYGRRLAMSLMVQPIAARPLLADPIANGQGFLARFLISEPPSAIGTRLRRQHSPCSNVAVVAAADRLNFILDHPKPTAENNPQELEPRQLPLSDGARELLWQFYTTVERQQAPGGDLEQVTAFASKAPEQAARIAGVMTLWDNLNAVEVSAATMTDGIVLAQYYLGEAKRLVEAAVVSSDIEQAERLRHWILKGWPDRARTLSRDGSTILPRDVVQYGPASLRETKSAKTCLTILADHGWLFALDPDTEIDGSPRKLAYRIVESRNELHNVTWFLQGLAPNPPSCRIWVSRRRQEALRLA